MHFSTITAASLALVGSAMAAPAPVALPAPASVQQQVITLENQIVYLANDIVQSNAANAEKDYAAGDSQFKALSTAVLSPGYTCPPSTAMGRPTEKNTVLEFLQTAQGSLQNLSLKLQNPKARPQKINNDLCNAYSAYKLTEYYVDEIISTSVSSLSLAVAATPKFDLTKYETTYLASLVSLEALISALNTAGSDTKTAMKNAQLAIKNYQTAAVLRDGECPLLNIVAPKNAKQAIKQVQGIETDVQKAFSDKKALNGKAFDDFCRINSFLVSVNSFVGA